MGRRFLAGAVVGVVFSGGLWLGASLGGDLARAQEVPPEPDLIRGGLEDLERINKRLRDAIDDYEEGPIDEDSLRRRIQRILEMKEAAIADLFRWYEVYGGSFAQWYFRFSRLDRFLDEAYLRSQLEEILNRRQISGPLRNAERLKKDVERELRERLRQIEEG